MKYLLIGLLFITPALSHSWYDAECCKSLEEENGDCRPVPCNEIIDYDKEHYQYKGMFFSKFNARASHDWQCHVCYSKGGVSYCVYLPETN